MRITITTVGNPGSKPMLTQVLSVSHSHTCSFQWPDHLLLWRQLRDLIPVFITGKFCP